MKVVLVFAALVAYVSCESAIEEFALGNHKFTAQLYKEILKDFPGNFIVSPLSIEIILALTQAGAVGPTAEEFTTALSLPASQQKTQEAVKKFLPTLKHTGDDLKLLSANKLFLGENFTILENFKKTATQVYDADATNLDFAANQQAANTINQWVEQHTNNKIQNLIDPSSLNSDTKLVLVNALYFSGKWVHEFQKWDTRKQLFYTTADNSKEVEMMHLEENFKYYECTKRNVQYLELPYLGGNISMTIVLPKEINGLAAIEQDIEGLLQDQPLEYERVAVTLPKFVVESDIKLKPILERLGLNRAFTNEANFSGISKTPLYISDVVQKAFINVTEEGTEAAAATAGEFDKFLSDYPIRRFRVDHPCFYYISDVITKNVFFVGQLSFWRSQDSNDETFENQSYKKLHKSHSSDYTEKPRREQSESEEYNFVTSTDEYVLDDGDDLTKMQELYEHYLNTPVYDLDDQTYPYNDVTTIEIQKDSEDNTTSKQDEQDLTTTADYLEVHANLENGAACIESQEILKSNENLVQTQEQDEQNSEHEEHNRENFKSTIKCLEEQEQDGQNDLESKEKNTVTTIVNKGDAELNATSIATQEQEEPEAIMAVYGKEKEPTDEEEDN